MISVTSVPNHVTAENVTTNNALVYGGLENGLSVQHHVVDRGIELDFYSVSGMAQRELLGMHVGSCLGLKLCAGVMVHLAQSLVCSPMSSLHVIRPGQEVNR